MEAQGAIQFLELKGQVYPALVREFYANFRYKDGKYWSMIAGKLFELSEDVFMNVGGDLTKASRLSVENRLLHYLIAYILVQRNTNHAQPTVNDLHFMYDVKNNVMFNWPEEILKVVDYLSIDVSDTIIVEYIDKDHLVGESLIHKMGIYKYGTTWLYQEDHTTVDLELSSDDDQAGTEGWTIGAQGEPSGNTSQEPAFGLAHMDAMEQRLNNRMVSTFRA
ncbi:unnamed protein product [Lupinus luteus]|uniref:Uncharacterized protein n=1 Tax=Lupinus luteus TaxID=3873 RepID=A0AAV1XEE9_LUPLU